MPMFKFSGTRPVNLGVRDGKLAPCPNKPNCVSSQASDQNHAIAPLALRGDAAATMEKLKAILKTMPRTEIIE
ncbi:MAG: DUF1499 domain-containing protein, partial [Candidatus Binatia bacterium]